MGHPEYTEGVCGDGVAILKDGVQITISEILETLNRASSARNDALEAAAGLRDTVADLIGVRPLSSIHSSLCEYAAAIRVLRSAP